MFLKLKILIAMRSKKRCSNKVSLIFDKITKVFISSKPNKTLKLKTSKFRQFSLFFFVFEDFEGLSEQIISIPCTQMNLYNSPKTMIIKFNLNFMLFENAGSSIVVMSCYQCIKTSKSQSSE